LAHASGCDEDAADAGLGVSLRRRTAVGLVIAAELAVLGIAVGVFLHSEEHTSFPSSVPVTSASSLPSTPVALNAQLRVVGVITTRAVITRGGHARGVRVASGPVRAEAGVVGFRRLSRSTR